MKSTRLKIRQNDKWLTVKRSQFFPYRVYDKIDFGCIHFALSFILFYIYGKYFFSGMLYIILVTYMEGINGTRPKRKQSFNSFRLIFNSQRDFEEQTISGFSIRRWGSGVIGMVLACIVNYLFINR